MQHAMGAASLAAVILLLLLFVWLLHDIMSEYSARRRFARLRALRNFWFRDGRRQTGRTDLPATGRKFIRTTPHPISQTNSRRKGTVAQGHVVGTRGQIFILTKRSGRRS